MKPRASCLPVRAGARSRAVSTTPERRWGAQETTPSEVAAALRALVVDAHAAQPDLALARALNLVCVVESESIGKIASRLHGVGRYHGSRTVVCQVEPGRSSLGATAKVVTDYPSGELGPAVLREQVDLAFGELRALPSIVGPLVVPDLTTVVWSLHRDRTALDALLDIAQVVLWDSADEPEVADALARAGELSERAYVVDLAWLRATPWRERAAALFAAPGRRGALDSMRVITVRHHAESVPAAVLLVGWLGSRLGWRPQALRRNGEGLAGSVTAAEESVEVRLEPTQQEVRGLAGVTVETGAGLRLSFDRAAGGLSVRQQARGGDERSWTMLGASRGERGILGEGIRQALLRDPTYLPALDFARELVRR
jgi:glucose-6-phosphate dehydrogenase assembly protein OpcA